MSNYNSNSEEDNICPICCEEMDVTDKNFQPCPCGFKICTWCWNKIEQTTQRCPNCRRVYDKTNIEFVPPNPELIQQEIKSKDKKKKTIFSRKQLANVRVIQRNLVYVVGLTLAVAKHEWLKHTDNFGKYGKIKKVVINKSNLHNSSHIAANRTPTVSAYITYAKKEDAYRAVRAVDKTFLDGKQLRASFGTTKYCAYFLKGVNCTNPDCMYLHEYGNEEDTFNKDEIVLRNGLPVPHNIEKMSQFYPPEDDPTTFEKHFWKYPNSNKEVEDNEDSSIHHHEEHYHDDLDDEDFEINHTSSSSNINNSNRLRKISYDNQTDEYYEDDEEDADDESDDVPTEYANLSVDANKIVKQNNGQEGILPKTARWGQQPIITSSSNTTNTSTSNNSTNTSLTNNNTTGTSLLSSNNATSTTATTNGKKKKNKSKKKGKKNKKENKKDNTSDTNNTNNSSNSTNNNTTIQNSANNSEISGRSSTEPPSSDQDSFNEKQEKLAMSVIDSIEIQEDNQNSLFGLNVPSTTTSNNNTVLNNIELISEEKSNISPTFIDPSVQHMANTYQGFEQYLPQLQQQQNHVPQQQQSFYEFSQPVQQLFAQFQSDPYINDPYANMIHPMQTEPWALQPNNNNNNNNNQIVPPETKRTSSRFFAGGNNNNNNNAMNNHMNNSLNTNGMNNNMNTMNNMHMNGYMNYNNQMPYQQQQQETPMGQDNGWGVSMMPYTNTHQQTSRFFSNIKSNNQTQTNPNLFNDTDLQNSFRALLPHVNITFASSNTSTNSTTPTNTLNNNMPPSVDNWGYNGYGNTENNAAMLGNPYQQTFFTQGYYNAQTANTWGWKE
ncbi:hypothetical protein ABK040_009813 [Willaertia magna]